MKRMENGKHHEYEIKTTMESGILEELKTQNIKESGPILSFLIPIIIQMTVFIIALILGV